MHEFRLPAHLRDKQNLLRAIQGHAEKIPVDSIFRIRSSVDCQLELLQIAELRKNLPESMNIDLLPYKDKTRSTWSAYSD